MNFPFEKPESSGKMNRYGDPEGTTYAGGNPFFDMKTGGYKDYTGSDGVTRSWDQVKDQKPVQSPQDKQFFEQLQKSGQGIKSMSPTKPTSSSDSDRGVSSSSQRKEGAQAFKNMYTKGVGNSVKESKRTGSDTKQQVKQDLKAKKAERREARQKKRGYRQKAKSMLREKRQQLNEHGVTGKERRQEMQGLRKKLRNGLRNAS